MQTFRHRLALLLATTALAACGGKDASAPEAAPAMAVTTVPAQVRSLDRAIRVSGPVTAWELMQLGTEVSGMRVTAVHADVGETVKRGQVLVELDARTLDTELAQSRAAYREAQAALQLAQANLSRAQALEKDRYISAGQVDELRAARAQAEARVATARASLDAAQLRRDFATLRAPDDGVIAERNVDPGRIVAAGTPLMTLIRDGRLEWRPQLAEADLGAVSVGDDVRVQASGGEVAGTVRAVSPGVSATDRTGTVYASLPEPDGLKLGAYVPGRILVGEARALTVPVRAVVRRDGYPYVFTVDAKGVAHRLRVELGSESQDAVEIRGGLKPGTRVILEGAGFVSDGDPVRVVPATATGQTAQTAQTAP